jgi:hypothetical protein
MSTRYWFRPRSFGYGATPITWEGWAFTLAMMAVTMVAILTAVMAETHQWPNCRSYQLACLIVVAVTQIVLIVVSRKKTEGEWRWRL